MGACEAACCGDEKGNVDMQQLSDNPHQVRQNKLKFLLTHALIFAYQKPFSQANLFELVIKDEK